LRSKTTIIHLCLLCLFNVSLGEDIISDTTEALSSQSAALRSVLIPGWGQIYQERLLTGGLYYASSAYFYYQSYLNFHEYYKRDQSSYRSKALKNLGIGAFMHLVSIGDALYVGNKYKPVGWQGALHGDIPLKSPWGATLRSAILPGWGQLYNESYLKGIFYFALNGYVFYKIIEARDKFNETKIPKYRDHRSRYSWYFGLTYLITLADAQVGAYLYKFDNAMQLVCTPALIEGSPGLTVYVNF